MLVARTEDTCGGGEGREDMGEERKEGGGCLKCRRWKSGEENGREEKER